MLAPKTTIRFTGPFFTVDPAKTVRRNIRGMIAALVKEGEKDVEDHYPTLTGRGKAGIRGVVSRDIDGPRGLRGTIFQSHVYAWAGRSQGNYRGGKTEAKYHMFRRTASRIRGMRAVVGADLTKGLE